MMNAPTIERLSGFVMLVGHEAVGKTALVKVLDLANHGKLPDSGVLDSIRRTNNMEFEFVTTQQEIGGNPYAVTIQFLVPPGRRREQGAQGGRSFEEVLEIYRPTLHRLDVILFTYNLTDRESFQDLPGWLPELGDLLNDATHFLLVGTYLDREGALEVSASAIEGGLETLAEGLRSLRPSWKGNYAHLEVSNLTGQNMGSLLYYIAGSIVSSRKMLP